MSEKCDDALKISEHVILTTPKLFALWDTLLKLADRDIAESDQQEAEG